MNFSIYIIAQNKSNLSACIQSIPSSIMQKVDVYVAGTYLKESITQLDLEQIYNGKILLLQSKSPADKSQCKHDLSIIRQNQNYNWIWLIKDTVLCTKDTIENLIKATQEYPLASYFVPFVSIYENSQNTLKNIDCDVIERVGALEKFYREYNAVLINTKILDEIGYPNSVLNKEEFSNYINKLENSSYKSYTVLSATVKMLDDEVPSLPSVCAIVVTYNRKAMLVKCINAILNQNYQKFDLLIVDNASTDGTYDEIKTYIDGDKVKYVNTGSNMGGSGGFYYGMRYATQLGYEYLWIMDDDVIPLRDSLSQLVSHIPPEEKISFMASSVYSQNGLPMNTPEISNYSPNGYRYWYKYLDRGMIRLQHATFVSLLINTEAVKKCGLPCKDYFIWGDDTEYTMRIIGKFAPAYFVGASKVYHLRSHVGNLSIIKEKDEKRVDMYYYLYRNTLINKSEYGSKHSVNAWISMMQSTIKQLKKSRNVLKEKKIAVLNRAYRDFVKKNYNYTAFKDRLDFDGQEKCILRFWGDGKVAQCLKDTLQDGVYTEGVGSNLLTTFEELPAFFREYIDTKVLQEDSSFVKVFPVEILEKMSSDNNRLVLDFYNCCCELIKFTKPKVAHVDYKLAKQSTDDEMFKQFMQSYDGVVVKSYEFDRKKLQQYIINFAVKLHDYKVAGKTILLRRKFVSQELPETEVAKYNEFLQEIYCMFTKRIPQLKVIDIADEIDIEQLQSKLYTV